MKTRWRESKGVEKERGEIDNDFEGEKEKEKIVIIELWERRVYICWRVKDREREREWIFQVLDCGERSCFSRIVL